MGHSEECMDFQHFIEEKLDEVKKDGELGVADVGTGGILDPNCDYLTLSEYSQLVGRHRITVTRWLKEGKVSGAMKIGGQWRVPVRKPSFGEDDNLLELISMHAEKACELSNEFLILKDIMLKFLRTSCIDKDKKNI